MAKKIVRNAGIVAVAGAAVIGSNIPANAFAEVPAATDLSYDYSSYEYDYSSYQTPATSYVAPQAEQQTEYVAPAQTAQVLHRHLPLPQIRLLHPLPTTQPVILLCPQLRLLRAPVTFGVVAPTVHGTAPASSPTSLLSRASS